MISEVTIRAESTGTPPSEQPNRAARRQSRKRPRSPFVALMLTPLTLLLAAFTLFPFFAVLAYAFQEMDLTRPDLDGFAGVANFVGALASPGLGHAVLLTVVLVVVTVVLEFALGLLAASLLWRPLPGSRLYLSLLVLPFAATPVASYLAWRLMLNPDGGQVNTLLGAMGLPTAAWTSDPTLSVVAIIAVDVWQWTPFVTLILVAGLQSLPHELFEAAALDGTTGPQRLWRIALPLLRPLIAFVITFRAIDAVRTFDSIWIITQGGPGSATETLTVRLYRMAFTNLDIGEASALAVVLLIVLILLGRLFASPALRRLEH